jgi:hypothetical protein
MDAPGALATVYGAGFQSFDVLKEGVQVFQCEAGFNGRLDLPSSLQHLILSDSFDHAIDLPASLESVRFGASFNTPGLTLPAGLKDVYFSTPYVHSLSIPDSCSRWTKDVQIWGHAPPMVARPNAIDYSSKPSLLPPRVVPVGCCA